MKQRDYGILSLMPTKASGKVLAFFIVSIVQLQFIWAAAEFLPGNAGNNATLTKRIASELPFIGHQGPNENYFKQMREGHAALRKQFKDFDKWSSEKPNPITISISQVKDENIRVSAMSKAQLKIVLPRVQELINSYVTKYSKNRKNPSAEEFKRFALNELVENILLQKEGPRGILIGLIQALPSQQKAELFKVGDPAEQIRLLRKSGLSDSTLGSSQFRPEVAGLSPNEVSVSRVLDIAESRLESSLQSMSILATYRYLSLLNSEKLASLLKGEKISETPIKILTSQEMGFLESSKSDAVKETIDSVTLNNPDQSERFQKALIFALNQISKSSFEATETTKKINTPFLKVIEVHPYLAYFRGCVGGDCSTSTSPMFPMSPWEHVFFIQTAKGDFTGYVSATRAMVDGEPTFYLKDISGSSLSGNHAALVLNAFEKIYSYYGVKKFAIATSEFTDSQNHFFAIKEALSSYNRKSKEKTLKFIDENIREFIGQTPLFGSSYQYDNPLSHQKAVFFIPNSEVLKNFEVTYQPGTLSAFKPSTARDSVMLALNLLAADPNTSLSDLPKVSEPEMKNLFALVENRNGANLEQHYKSLTSSFAKYDIELSRSFRHDNELVFSEGHLRAIDALSTKDESLFNDSEKFFTGYVRRHGDVRLITNFAIKWKRALNLSKRMGELLNLLSQRADPRDVVYLMLFADAGIEGAKNALHQPKVKARLSEAIVRYTERRGIRNGSDSHLPPEASTFGLFKIESLAKNASHYTSNAFSQEFQSILTTLGLNQNAFQDPQLLNWYNGQLIKTKNAFDSKNKISNLTWLKKNSNSASDSVFEALILHVAQLQKEPIADAYITELKSHPTEANFMRVYALAQTGYRAASDILKSEKGSSALIRMADQWNETASLSPETLNIYKYYKEYGSIKKGTDFLELYSDFVKTGYSFRNLSALYAKVDQLLASSGLDLSTLFLSKNFLHRMTKNHLNTSDAFTSKNQTHLGFTLRFFALDVNTQAPSEDYDTKEAFNGRKEQFFDNIKQFSKLPDYPKFIVFLSEKSKDECHQCVPLLRELLNENQIPDISIFSTPRLKELIQVNHFEPANILVVAELNRRGERKQIDPMYLPTLLYYLVEQNKEQRNNSTKNFNESAFSILYNQKLENYYARHNLLAFIALAPTLVDVYKAASIYVQTTNDLEDLNEAVNDAEKEFSKKSSAQSAETLYWAHQYESIKKDRRIRLTDYSGIAQIHSCENLINKLAEKK